MSTTLIEPRRARRVRHEPRIRTLEVARVETLTPRMRRITFTGDELEGFVSAAADDHIKLLLPPSPGERLVLPVLGPNGMIYADDAPRPIGRDYTPRRFDAQARELTIEFVLHGDGPAASWAAQARAGQCVGIGGPRGSFVPADAECLLLVGDETALPAISRRLEELEAGARAIALVEIEDEAEIRRLPTAGNVSLSWLPRRGAAAGAPNLLLAALRAAVLPPAGDIEAWMAGETGAIRRLREHLVTERGLPRERVRASGYWRRGEVAGHDRIED